MDVIVGRGRRRFRRFRSDADHSDRHVERRRPGGRRRRRQPCPPRRQHHRLSLLATELSAKRLELLKETLPGLARVAVLWNPTNASVHLKVRETTTAARLLGPSCNRSRPRYRPIARCSSVRGEGTRRHAMVTADDQFLSGQRVKLISLDMHHRLPVASAFKSSSRRRPRQLRAESHRQAAATASTSTRILKAPSRPTCLSRSHQVRADHQHQDGEGARPHDPAVGAAAGG